LGVEVLKLRLLKSGRLAPPGLCHYNVDAITQVRAQLAQQTHTFGKPLDITGTVDRDPALFILRVPKPDPLSKLRRNTQRPQIYSIALLAP
jgi:hypothetical protein